MTISQGEINRIRKKYNGNMKLGYDTEYSVSYPNFCIKCNKNQKIFINYSKGYSDHCSLCKKEEQKNKIKIRKFKLEDFLEHYKENPDFYNNNFSVKNIYLEYFKTHTGIYTLSSYIRKYFGSKNFKKWEFTCDKCSYITKIDYFNKNPKCGSHSCRNFRREQSINKQIKDKFKWENRDLKKDYICKETGVFYHLNSIKKLNELKENLKKLNIEYNDYLKKHHGDLISHCLECNKQLVMKNHFPYKKYTKKFCSNDHYYKHCKKHPSYGGRGSKERRDKQSNTLKNKIKNGDFTPCRNHYTSWGTVNSLNGKKYRSRWELIFHLANPDMEYETKRIKYFDKEKNKERIYIIDFFDPITGNIYEIKPSSEMITENVISKRESAIKYAQENNVEYIFINEDKIIECYDNIKNQKLEKDIDECVKKLKEQRLRKLKK